MPEHDMCYYTTLFDDYNAGPNRDTVTLMQVGCGDYHCGGYADTVVFTKAQYIELLEQAKGAITDKLRELRVGDKK